MEHIFTCLGSWSFKHKNKRLQDLRNWIYFTHICAVWFGRQYLLCWRKSHEIQLCFKSEPPKWKGTVQMRCKNVFTFESIYKADSVNYSQMFSWDRKDQNTKKINLKSWRFLE